MITLDDIQASLHSIKISDGSNDLLIDASGHLSFNDGGNSITVDAVGLDIRGLSSVSDSVAAVQSGVWAVDISDNGGSITVDAIGLDIRGLAFASDSVTAHQGGTWSVETTPGGYASWKVSAETATTTESELVSTPLIGRLSVLVQNLGSQDIYLKEATGVSAANGMKVPKGSSYSANLDDGANLFAITSAGSADLRVVEYAA